MPMMSLLRPGVAAGASASVRTCVRALSASASASPAADAAGTGAEAAREAASKAAPLAASKAADAAAATAETGNAAKSPTQAASDAAYAVGATAAASEGAAAGAAAAGGNAGEVAAASSRTAEEVARLLAINRKRVPQQSHTLHTYHRTARQKAVELYHMTANFHPTKLPAHVVDASPAVRGQAFDSAEEKHEVALQADLEQRIKAALTVQTPKGGVDPRGGVVPATRDPKAPAHVTAMAPPKFYNAGQLLRLAARRTDRVHVADKGQAWTHDDEVSQEVMQAIVQGAAPSEALDKDVQTYLQRAHFRDAVTPRDQRPKVGKSRTLASLVDRREARVRDALFGTIGGALPGEALLQAREEQRKALLRQRKQSEVPKLP